MATTPAAVTRALEHEPALDAPQEAIGRVRAAIPDAVLDELEGNRLGHALHPLFTDLPIGFWTTSFCLDLVAPRRAATSSRRFVGLGVLSAVPAIATGLADFGYLSPGKRRVAAVHVAANATATAAYALSYLARRRGQTGRGIALGMVGAGLATAGGFLGGHLAFGHDSLEDEAEAGHDPAQLQLIVDDDLDEPVGARNGHPVGLQI